MSTEAQIDLPAEMDRLQIPYETDVPLGPLTWYRVGGEAQVFARPQDADQLAALVRLSVEQGFPVRVLGRGANLLVLEGALDGVVVSLDAEPFRRVQIDAASARVTTGGGASLEKTITATVREGLAGLENLAGIPASIGGALRMNAGGAFGEIGPYVESVTLVDAAGALRTLPRDELEFSYRHSNLADGIVTEAVFHLEPVDDRPALRQRLKEVMAYKKGSQPMAEQSAGCCFKNPRGQSEHGAGKLIDDAGLKGLRIGGAEVSHVHANFVIVHEGAAARDVLAVMDEVQRRVADKFGVHIQREVVVWGDEGG